MDIEKLCEEVLRLDREATAGEWRYVEQDNVIVFEEFRTLASFQPRSLHVSTEDRNANGYCIAAYRTACPTLARECRTLREENARLRGACQEALNNLDPDARKMRRDTLAQILREALKQ